MNNQATNETAGIRYAYIHDPTCPMRVVTIAYTVDEAIGKSDHKSVTYAFAINRVDTYRHNSRRIKNYETTDQPRKTIGREIATYRLIHIESATVGHCYVKNGDNVVSGIVEEHLFSPKHFAPIGRPAPGYLKNVFNVFTRVRQLTPTTERTKDVRHNQDSCVQA